MGSNTACQCSPSHTTLSDLQDSHSHFLRRKQLPASTTLLKLQRRQGQHIDHNRLCRYGSTNKWGFVVTPISNKTTMVEYQVKLKPAGQWTMCYSRGKTTCLLASMWRLPWLHSPQHSRYRLLSQTLTRKDLSDVPLPLL